MRQIKFRVWNPKQMRGMIVCENLAELAEFIGVAIRKANDLKGYTFLQFTGLTDKNGKEIYEGDIVKCQQGCNHEVVWEDEIGGTFGGGMPGWYLKGLIKNGGKGYAWTGEEALVGNIYENPELLKATPEEPN